VTAALVQAGFPLLVVERHQRGDQGVPSLGRQPGQGRVAEPGQVGTGLVEGVRSAGGLVPELTGAITDGTVRSALLV
jgi:hypothetical protein